jgi:hypothetical protein
VQIDYDVVHLRTSLVQLFVLLQLNFEEVVQIIELRRFWGAPNGYPFAALSRTRKAFYNMFCFIWGALCIVIVTYHASEKKIIIAESSTYFFIAVRNHIGKIFHQNELHADVNTKPKEVCIHVYLH